MPNRIARPKSCATSCPLTCYTCVKACHDCGVLHQVRPYGPRAAWVCVGCTKVSPQHQAEAKALEVARQAKLRGEAEECV